MWIYLLYIACIWVLIGLAVSAWVKYMCRQAEKSIERDEEGAKEQLLPQLLLVYAIIEGKPGLLEIACMAFWPYLLYNVFIKN